MFIPVSVTAYATFLQMANLGLNGRKWQAINALFVLPLLEEEIMYNFIYMKILQIICGKELKDIYFDAKNLK